MSCGGKLEGGAGGQHQIDISAQRLHGVCSVRINASREMDRAVVRL